MGLAAANTTPSPGIRLRQPSTCVVFQFHHSIPPPSYNTSPFIPSARQLLAAPRCTLAKIYFYRLRFPFNPIHFAGILSSYFFSSFLSTKFAKICSAKTLIFGHKWGKVLWASETRHCLAFARRKLFDISGQRHIHFYQRILCQRPQFLASSPIGHI